MNGRNRLSMVKKNLILLVLLFLQPEVFSMRKGRETPEGEIVHKRLVRQIALPLAEVLRKKEKPYKVLQKKARQSSMRPRTKTTVSQVQGIEDCLQDMEISPREPNLLEKLEPLKNDVDHQEAQRVAAAQVIAEQKLAGTKELITLINQGSIDKLIEVLARNPDLEACDEIGRTPLICAIFTSNIDMVRLLIEAGAKTGVGKTNPMAVAQLVNNEEIKALLQDTSREIHFFEGEESDLREKIVRSCECQKCIDDLKSQNMNAPNVRSQLCKDDYGLSPEAVEAYEQERLKQLVEMRKELARQKQQRLEESRKRAKEAADRRKQIHVEPVIGLPKRRESLDVADEPPIISIKDLTTFIFEFDREEAKAAQEKPNPTILDQFDLLMNKFN